MICFQFHKVYGGQIWAQTSKIEHNCSFSSLKGNIRTYAFRENYLFRTMTYFTPDISYESVCESDFFMFYHCVR